MANCKDCIHSGICASHLKAVIGIYGAVMSISGREINHLESALSEVSTTIGQICCDDCDHFQDRSRFVELPCKVGDKVYVIEDIAGEAKIIQDVVETIGIGYYADGINIYQFDGIKTDGYFSDFGKTVFLTREEAEQALNLKERENNAGQNDI